MISKQNFLSALLLFSGVSFVSNLIQSSYQSHYFSSREVFCIIENKDERGFDAWMRTYPEVNIFNQHNQTPLMIAAQMQMHSFVTRLLDAGAYKYYVDNFGRTARDYALIAEGNYDNSSYSSSSDSSQFWSAVGTGIVAGLCAGALYGLCKESDNASLHVSYSLYGDHYYDYCAKCSSYVGYTTDPLSLYCSTCYRAYCKQQAVVHSPYLSSYRMSDRL